jgi:methionine-rich copper-binding protein CopC
MSLVRAVRPLPLFRRGALAALVGALLVAAAARASAHDELRSTSPAAGAVVDALPTQVVLTFDEPALAVGTEVQVTGPAGLVSDGPPQLSGTEVRQPVRSGPAGRYTVTWRATSADGHPVSGTFGFTTQRASSPTTSTTTPSTTSTTTATATTTTAAAATSSPTSVAPVVATQTWGLSGPLVAIVVLVVLALLALAGWALYRRRQRPDVASR